jgi:PhnB protein
MANVAAAERIFRDLSQDGRVIMPLEKTFWAARFGMVIDRFGIPWAINCEEPGQSGPGA